MSEMKIHSSWLNGIANAIRSKTNTTTRLTLAQIQQAIAGYPGNIQQGGGATALEDAVNGMLRIDGDALSGIGTAIRSVNGDTELMTPWQMINAINNFTHNCGEFDNIRFADATYEQLVQMLSAHYAGDIDISDYWDSGDTRVIHLEQMVGTDGTTIYPAQDITLVILAFNHHQHEIIEYGQQINVTSAVTIGTRECLNNLTAAYATALHSYINGVSQLLPLDFDWLDSAVYRWLNNQFYNALPDGLKLLIKDTLVPSISNAGSGIFIYPNKVFLPSYPEVFGTNSYTEYLGGEFEGTQLPYFWYENRRIKYGNDNGSKNSEKQFWHLRSVSNKTYNSSRKWCSVGTDGKPNSGTGQVSLALSPMFCL